MGNQHSLGQNDTVFQNNGQYIVPNKLNHPQTVQQEEIVNNIFGINDPTLLTRSYWAKDQNKSPFNNKDQKSPAKSRLYSEQMLRAIRQYEPDMKVHYEDEIDRKQQFTKSIVTDFRVDQIIVDPSQVRNLSKNTSYSIIHKLNKYDDESQSQSPFKNSQLSKTNDLRYSKLIKNKENFNYLLGSGKINNSQSKAKENQKKDMQRPLSAFKGTQNLSQENSRRKVLDDVTLRSQISNIFGLGSLQEEKCEQLTDRLEEQLKSMRKTEVGGQKSQIITERSVKNDQSHQRSWNQVPKQQPSCRVQNEFCQQTFSRFQEQNAYPAYLSKSSEKEISQKSSKKTGSKKSDIQKYKGLNQDSHNESLMKVMKRITDLNLKIEDHDDRNSQQTIKINRPVVEDNTDIMNQNWKYQDLESRSIKSNKDISQKSSKKIVQNNQERSNFRFDLKEVHFSQKSQKSLKSQASQQSKSRHPQQSYESNESSEKSQGNQSSKLSYKKTNSNQISDNYQNGTGSVSNHYCLQNDIYQTESSQGLDDGYSERLRFHRNQSPRSLASQQRIMTRQRSCSGRLIQTSKASQKSQRENEKSYKNFDFSKKSYNQNEQRSVQSKKYKPEQSQKPSKHSIKDYQLLLKIQTLQEELKRLKTKEQLQKFESRRYSPVKQQRMKFSKNQSRENGSESEQDIGVQQSKYCINSVSSTKPLKRRSQYFKLKIKQN